MATGDSTSPGRGGAEPPLTVDELHDHDTGRWQIITRTSIYLLDLDHRHVTRIPGTADEHGLDKRTGIVYVVRGFAVDRRAQPLVELVVCRRGEPLGLYLGAGADLTVPLTSTPIREIRRLTPRR